jgi:hypothetical protein
MGPEEGDRVALLLPNGLEAFERLTGVPVTEQCGSTETEPYAMNPPFGRKKPGSVGPPSHGVHVALVDEQGADVPTGWPLTACRAAGPRCGGRSPRASAGFRRRRARRSPPAERRR